MRRKSLAILFSLAMILTMIPASVFASETAQFSDMPNNWSTAALNNAVANGLLKGDDGKIMPDNNLTRAQMAAVINRAFGTTEKVSISSYTDVAAGAWYYDDMAKAVQMKTFVGSGDNKLNPDNNITREESFIVLANAFKLSGATDSTLNKFSDKNSVSTWVKDTANGFIEIAKSYKTIGEEINIATQQEISIGQLAEELIKQINPNAKIVCDDQRLRPEKSEVNRI